MAAEIGKPDLPILLGDSFDSASLDAIASRAEVSPGMIAYYFGDRQGLYEAMFQRVLDRISEKVAALIEDPTTDGDDRIDELLRLQVATVASMAP